jgi:hypothetical protein
MLSSLPDTVWEGNFSGYRQSDLDYAQRVSRPGSKIKKRKRKKAKSKIYTPTSGDNTGTNESNQS